MKKILFVDDSITFTAMMSNALRMGGFEVVTAAKCGDVLPIVQAGGLDLVILDMILPDGTGIELLRKIKADEKTKQVPVVILTARENADEIAEVMKNGGYAHLVKYKTTPKTLLESVKSWLK